MVLQTFPRLVMHMLLALGLILVSSQVGSGSGLSPAYAPAPALGPSSSYSSLLEVGFYDGKCGAGDVDVEAIIAAAIKKEFLKDPTLLPAMLRLQFHDSFVNGADASILISGNLTEKAAGPNGSVRGYEVIDAIKEAVESECPGVVSCADIIVVSTATLMQLGGVPPYKPETGRRDGPESNVLDVDLPSPTMSVAEAIAFFAVRGFTARQMVALLGAHSVGITHCPIIQDRLDATSSLFDALIEPKLRAQLDRLCPIDAMSNNAVPLNPDATKKDTVDNSFYRGLIKHRGILQLDQALSTDPLTSAIVLEFAKDVAVFYDEFVKAIIQLQALDVFTGTKGEIRKVCSKFN